MAGTDMGKSTVYFTDFRCPVGTSQLDKLKKLCIAAGIKDIDMDGKFVAIKMHFGGCGIWNRWKDYVADGHGGNKELKKIVKDKGFEYIQNNFHYTLLEQILNTASNEYVISRENYWKEVLLSRKFGYNSN